MAKRILIVENAPSVLRGNKLYVAKRGKNY